MTLAVCLLVVAFGLVMVEIAVPSFGLLSLLAAGAYTWAVVLAFQQGATTGWSFVGVGIVLLPLAIGLGFKILPRTPIGKRMVLQRPEREELVPESDREDLQGRSGVALTDLRPSGLAEIDGARRDVVAAGRFIEKGSRIIVTRVRGHRIVVEEEDKAE